MQCGKLKCKPNVLFLLTLEHGKDVLSGTGTLSYVLESVISETKVKSTITAKVKLYNLINN